MKSTKNIVFIVIIALTILSQFYYGFTTYKQDCAVIASNKEQIASVQSKIDVLEAKLAKHEESKQELARLETEKKALLETIPTQKAYSQFLSKWYDYLFLVDYSKMNIKQIPATVINNQIGQIYKRDFEVEYISTYTDSRKMIEHLNSMYQASSINKYGFDSSLQAGEGAETAIYKAQFGDEYYELGKTTFTFSVFYRVENGIQDELYQPNVSAQVNSTQPFRNDKSITGTASEVAANTNLPEEKPTTAPISMPDFSGSRFDLNIGDFLISGDTYKLKGPGDGEGHYIGLSSRSNTNITIVAYDDHYELSLEDDKGQVKQSSYFAAVNKPCLQIISNMRQLEAVMPNVHVYVYNYTENIMPIKIEGSLTENIHIFNEQDQMVLPGETKGNISLT